jgi:hypothetical protein
MCFLGKRPGAKMAYWWVSQNKTFKQEREGGYMWAPKRDTAGKELHHWSNMTRVRPGDIIFSYAQQAIGAVGTAVTAAYDARKPAEFEGGWEDEAGVLMSSINKSSPQSLCDRSLMRCIRFCRHNCLP